MEVVPALGRELGDDRSIGTGLEPVARVRRHRELLAGEENDLPRCGVYAAACACRARLWVKRRTPFHVQEDHTRPNPERFLLARRAVKRWMADKAIGEWWAETTLAEEEYRKRERDQSTAKARRRQPPPSDTGT